MGEQDGVHDELFNFSSSPCSPRENYPEIRVRFQAVTESHPCILYKCLSLRLDLTLSGVRRILHPYFSECYERGFIFLWKNREVGRPQEQILTLCDILPKPPHGVPSSQFLFQDVQYKKVAHKKKGKRKLEIRAGIVYLFEESGVNKWDRHGLNITLSSKELYGFSFIPSSITSSVAHIIDLDVERMNEFAAMGLLTDLQVLCDKVPPGTDVSCMYDKRRATPLHYACAIGDLDVCSYLIGRFGRQMLYMTDTCLATPLHHALKRGHVDVVAYLLQLLPDMTSRDIFGQSCRHLLFFLNDIKTESLLSVLDTHISLFDDKLILHLTCLAIQKGQTTIARKLCRVVNVFPPLFYRPPLHLAAEFGDEEMIKSLVSNGHKLLEADPDGHIPIQYAVQHDRHWLLPLLYKSNISEKDFMKCVKLSVTWRNYHSLAGLSHLRGGLTINDNLKEMMLTHIEKYPRKVKPIIDVFLSDGTVLGKLAFIAARENLLEELELLAVNNVNLNIKDHLGRTPLHYAVECEHGDIVDYLLIQGVDPNAQDWQGSSPLHYACRSGNTHIIQRLINQSKTDINIPDCCGRSPLLSAAYNKQIKVVVQMLNNSVNAWQKDKYNQTLMHYFILLPEDEVSSILDIIPSSPKVPISDFEKSTYLERKGAACAPKQFFCACNYCGRIWHYFAWQKKNTHVCKSPEGLSVRAILYDSSDNGLTELRCVSQPFKHSLFQNDKLSSIKMHIIANKIKHLKRLVELILEDLTEDDLLYLLYMAIKYLSIEAFTVLQHFIPINQTILSDLLQVAVVTECNCNMPKRKQIRLVKHLLDMGGIPNYFGHLTTDQLISKWAPQTKMDHEAFSDYLEKNGKTSEDSVDAGKQTSYQSSLLLRLKLTKRETDDLNFCPLEIAVIQDNVDLVELLLQYNAIPSICFALHLALLRDCNIKIIDMLLSNWTVYNEVDVIGSQDIDEMHRLSSLPGGIVQAFYRSVNPSICTLKLILKSIPDILSNSKLLTAMMVESVRPTVLQTIAEGVKPFLYRRTSQRHFVSNLPLTSLVLKQTCDQRNDLIAFMLKNGTNLSAVRVGKSSEIHLACEMFVEASKRNLWTLCDQISNGGGDVIWTCLYKHSTCHKHVYGYTKDNSTPLCSPVILNFLAKAPLSCVISFFSHSSILKAHEIKDENSVSNIDDAIVQCLHSVSNQRNGLLICCKVLLRFPHLLNPVLDFMTLMPKQSWFRYVSKGYLQHYDSMRKVMNFVYHRVLEVSMMTKLMKMSSDQVEVFQRNEFNVVHLGCMLSNLSIVKRSYQVFKLDADPSRVKISFLDCSAAFGHINILKYLIEEGEVISTSTFTSACTGPEWTGMEKSFTRLNGHIEEDKLLVIKWLFERAKFNRAHMKDIYASLLELSVSLSYWCITIWCLETFDDIHLADSLLRGIVLTLLKRGPTDVCMKVFEKFHESWLLSSTKDEVYDILYHSIIRNDHIKDHILHVYFKPNGYSVVDLIAIPNKHGMNLLHFFCAQGRKDNVKFVLDSLKETDQSISSIINSYDFSKATPLWYALAWQHWDLAEILMLNGAFTGKERAIPMIDCKRLFQTKTQKIQSRYTLKSQVKRNTSHSVARFVGSDEQFFMKIYQRNSQRHKCQLQHVTTMSDITVPSVRLKYLFSLMSLAREKDLSMMHVAVGVGDYELVSHIQRQPLYENMIQRINVCPLTVAILNLAEWRKIKQQKAKACCNFKNAVIQFISQNLHWHSIGTSIKRCSNYLNWDASICNEVEMLIKEITLMKQGNNHISFNHNRSCLKRYFFRDLILEVIAENVQLHKGFICNSFLFVIGVVGYPWLFDIINVICKTSKELFSTITRPVIGEFHLIDLLFIFTDKDSRYGQKNIDDRVEFLERVSQKIQTIHLSKETIAVIKNKRLFNMMCAGFKSGLLSFQPEIQLALFEATIWNGDNCVANELWDLLNWEDLSKEALIRIACACVLKGNTLLLSNLAQMNKLGNDDYLLKNLKHPSSQRPPLSIIECAIIKGDIYTVDILIYKIKEANIDSQDLKSLLTLAFSRGNMKICQRLEKFIRSISRHILSVDEYLQLFTLAVRKGHEYLALYLFESQNASLTGSNERTLIDFHYACMYGMGTLVNKMLTDSSIEVNKANTEGFSGLDYSRAFGHIELSTDLVEKYRARSFQESRRLIHYGWFSRSFQQNSKLPSTHVGQHPYIGQKRKPLSLLTMLELGDDFGSASFVMVAPDTVVSRMESSYEKFPLLHLCCRYNCLNTIKILFRSLDKYSVNSIDTWLNTEWKLKTPVAEAIECKNIAILSEMLKIAQRHDQLKFKNGETIYHLVARNGNEDICRLVTENMLPDFRMEKDENGLTPSATAIAFGNQHILHYFSKSLTDINHRDHCETIYNCLECLMDSCIGWFKRAQNKEHVSSSILNRNVLSRNKTFSGFTVHKRGNRRRYHHHPLKKILKWREICGSDILVNIALNSMGYSSNPVLSKLFLLCSHSLNHSSILNNLSVKDSDVAMFLINNGNLLQEDFDDFVVKIIAKKMNDVFKLLSAMHHNAFEAKDKRGCSALDAAYAMGNYNVVQVFESEFTPYQRFSKLSVLPSFFQTVSLLVKYRLMPHQPSVTNVLELTDSLSIYDYYRILPPNIRSEFFQAVDLGLSRHLSLSSFSCRTPTFHVDSKSLRNCCTFLNLSETEILSIILSSSVTGRFYNQQHDNMWKTADEIVVRCLSQNNDSDTVSVVVDNGTVYDNIKFLLDDSENVCILETGELNTSTKDIIDYRNVIDNTILDELTATLREEMPAIKCDIHIDWQSFQVQNIEQQECVLKLLASRDSSNPLMKLKNTFIECGKMLRDISLLINKNTAQSIFHLFKHLSRLIICFSNIHCPTDESCWDIKETSVCSLRMSKSHTEFSSYDCKIYSIIKICHSILVNLAECLTSFSFHLSGKEKPLQPKISVDWSMFPSKVNRNELRAIFGDCVKLQLSRVGEVYRSMPYLKLNIDEIVISATILSESCRVMWDKNVLYVVVHVFKCSDGTWKSTDIDLLSQLTALQTEQLVSKCLKSKRVRGRQEQFQTSVKAFKEVVDINESFSVAYTESELLQIVCDTKYTDMTHPSRLIQYYHDKVIYTLDKGIKSEISTRFQFSNFCWMLSKCKLKSSFWCWLTFDDMASLPESLSYITVISRRAQTISFEQRRKHDLLLSLGTLSRPMIWVDYNEVSHDLNIHWQERIQLLSFDNHVYFVSDWKKAASIFDNIPKTIRYRLDTETNVNSADCTVNLDSLFSIPFIVRDDTSMSTNLLYFQIWEKLISCGYNFRVESENIESIIELDLHNLLDIISDQKFTLMVKSNNIHSVVVRFHPFDHQIDDMFQNTNERDLYIHVNKISINQSENLREIEDCEEIPQTRTDASDICQLSDYDDCDVPLTEKAARVMKKKRGKLETKTLHPTVNRIRTRKIPDTLLVERATDLLLSVAGKGKTAVIQRSLDNGADINAQDNKGRTPLILAAKSSRLINIKLLLQNGANLNKVDQNGRTALHYEAANGAIDSLILLVIAGAKINHQDYLGMTALWYAINNERSQSAEILIFCGADATIRDKKKQSMFSVCDDPYIKWMVKESKRTGYALRNGLASIEFAELKADTVHKLSKVGITLSVSSTLGSGCINFICRRVEPEFCSISFTPAANELFLSDIFEYKWTGNRYTEFITVNIPVYSKVDVFDEVFVKTDKGIRDSSIIEITKGSEELTCNLKIRLIDMNAFVLIARPKKDRFLITSDSAVFHSTIDHLVQVSVDRDYSRTSGCVHLEVIPKSDQSKKPTDQILSYSHFYNFYSNDTMGDLTVTLPLPIDYFSRGQLYVMCSTFKTNGSVEDINCRILTSKPSTHHGVVTFVLKQGGCCNLLEWSSQSDCLSERKVIESNIQLLKKARKREYGAVFMTVMKASDKDEYEETVIECVRKIKVQTRFNDWYNQGYRLKSQKMTEVNVYPEQELDLATEGDLQQDQLKTIKKLQFHPYRNNFKRFKLKSKMTYCQSESTLAQQPTACIIGKNSQLTSPTATETDSVFPNTNIMMRKQDSEDRQKLNLTLADNFSRVNNISGSRMVEPQQPFKGFLDDNWLTVLSSELDGEWQCMALYLGLTRKTVFEIQQSCVENNSFKMFELWRKSREKQSDCGLQELFLALNLMGKKQLLSKIKDALFSRLKVDDKRFKCFQKLLLIIDNRTSNDNQ